MRCTSVPVPEPFCINDLAHAAATCVDVLRGLMGTGCAPPLDRVSQLAASAIELMQQCWQAIKALLARLAE
jgi:hypothetical protein